MFYKDWEGWDVQNGPETAISFFFSFCVSYILTIFFRVYLCFKGAGRVMVGGDYENGPN
jgi:hypothetical protein